MKQKVFRFILGLLPAKARILLSDRVRRRMNIKKYVDLEINIQSDKGSLSAFDYYKCIFIHIPKTGGMSISRSLFNNQAGWHRPLQYYVENWAESTIQKYFKFAFVRHPETRLVSAFKYLKGGGFNRKDKEFAASSLADMNDVNDFVVKYLENKAPFPLLHLRSQWSFVSNESKIQLDFIGKFESIDEDYKHVAGKLNIAKPLAHINKSKEPFDAQLCLKLTERSKKIIYEFYKEDYIHFGYQPTFNYN
jgi:hypothetical protein